MNDTSTSTTLWQVLRQQLPVLLMVFGFLAFLKSETIIELVVFGVLITGFIGWVAIRGARTHRRQGERRFRLGRPDVHVPKRGRATYIGLAFLFGVMAAAVLTISELQKTEAMTYALILLGLAAACLLGIVTWGKRLLLSLFWGSFLLAGLATILWGVWRYRTADCFRSCAVIKTTATRMRHEARSDHRRISVPANVPIAFQLEYSPGGGDGQGHISYRLTNTGTGRSQRRLLDLTPEERRSGARFNAFGLINLASPDLNSQCQASLFVDDLILRFAGDSGTVFDFATKDKVAAEGWKRLGPNPDANGSGVDFGFSNSNHAGSDAGEIGGFFGRSVRASAYAYLSTPEDKGRADSEAETQIQDPPLEQPLGATGRFILEDRGFDGQIAIGWFQANEESFGEPRELLGLILLEPNRGAPPLIGLIQSSTLGGILAVTGLLIGIGMFTGGMPLTDQGLQGPWGFVSWDQLSTWQLVERPGRTVLSIELPNGWELRSHVPSGQVEAVRELLEHRCPGGRNDAASTT